MYMYIYIYIIYYHFIIFYLSHKTLASANTLHAISRRVLEKKAGIKGQRPVLGFWSSKAIFQQAALAAGFKQTASNSCAPTSSAHCSARRSNCPQTPAFRASGCTVACHRLVTRRRRRQQPERRLVRTHSTPSSSPLGLSTTMTAEGWPLEPLAFQP